jgi:hypothetical protein
MTSSLQTPCTKTTRVRASGWLIIGPVCAALVVLPLAVVAAFAPKFVEIFRDFGVALPLATRGILRLGDAMATPLGIAGLFVLTGAVWMVAAMAWRIRAAAGLAILVLCTAWALVSIPLIVISVLLPLTAMTESLQQQKGP